MLQPLGQGPGSPGSPEAGELPAKDVVASWGLSPYRAPARIGGRRSGVATAAVTIEAPQCSLCFLLSGHLAELAERRQLRENSVSLGPPPA